MLISLRVENFGSFESATIEIKPLTILIGKNYVGKSLLLYLLWTLTSAYPSFEEVKSEWGPSIKIAEMIVNKVARGEPPRDELVEVTKIFYNNVFKKAVEIGLNEKFEYVFGVGIKELIKEGKNKALIELQSECGKLRLAILGSLRIEELNICLDRVLNTLQVKILSRSGYVNIKYDENVEREVVMFSIDDINDVITGIIAYSISLQRFLGFSYQPILSHPYYQTAELV